MNDSYMNILKNEVLVNLEKCNCDNDSISNISSMFDAINNQFSNLKSEHKRLNVLEDMGVLIRPKEIPIGTIFVDEVKNNNKVLKAVDVNTYYIPLNKLFKLFFEQTNVFKIVTNYLDELSSNKKYIISSFVQSEVWQKKNNKSP